MWRCCLPILVSLSIPLGSAAGDEPGEPIGPADAVRLALEHNPRLLAADAGLRAAEADRRAASASGLPRIEFTEDWVRSNNPVFVFSSKLLQGVFATDDFAIDVLNEPEPITNSTARLSIYQSIWNGRNSPEKKTAVAGVAVAESSQRKARDEVVFTTLEAYWALASARRMMEVTADGVAAAEANLALARELVDAGLAVPSDRLAAEVRLADVRATSVRAEYGVEVAHAALLRALGEDRPEMRYVPIETDRLPELGDDSLERRTEQAMLGRADLAELDRRIEQARIGARSARAGRYPEIGAAGSYEWNGERLLAADGENWAVGLALRMTIFDGHRTDARVQRAAAELAQLEAMRVALAQGVRLEVASAWAERESAARRLELAATALEQAGEVMRIVRERYGEGVALVVELLSAEAALTAAQAQQVVAVGELWLADAGLDLASGTDPIPDLPSVTTGGPG
ncbi:MAG TPA: TolC family protein [Candidatus Polarisedimenticolaceae bacterium]|nr:TolC family protein [Candidatus Polarisedimenticolaceae bacterium]